MDDTTTDRHLAKVGDKQIQPIISGLNKEFPGLWCWQNLDGRNLPGNSTNVVETTAWYINESLSEIFHLPNAGDLKSHKNRKVNNELVDAFDKFEKKIRPIVKKLFPQSSFHSVVIRDITLFGSDFWRPIKVPTKSGPDPTTKTSAMRTFFHLHGMYLLRNGVHYRNPTTRETCRLMKTLVSGTSQFCHLKNAISSKTSFDKMLSNGAWEFLEELCPLDKFALKNDGWFGGRDIRRIVPFPALIKGIDLYTSEHLGRMRRRTTKSRPRA